LLIGNFFIPNVIQNWEFDKEVPEFEAGKADAEAAQLRKALAMQAASKSAVSRRRQKPILNCVRYKSTIWTRWYFTTILFNGKNY
jgi:hypothetical protein